MQVLPIHRRVLAATISVFLAGSLAACGGGGGGNVRPPVPPVVPGDTCTTNPAAPECTPPTDNGGDTGNGGDAGNGGDSGNGGDGGTPTPSYAWPYDNQLVPTHVNEAHDAGLTGAGVAVAVIDAGIDLTLPQFRDLKYVYANFRPDGGTEPVDSTGHGSMMLGILGGSPVGDYKGGIVPDAAFYLARVCGATAGGCRNIGDAIEMFFDQGVRLFNLSLGAPSSDFGKNLPPSDAAIASGSTWWVDGGALFVWGAGNKGAEHISIMAVAPYYHPEAQRGWLSVVNVALDHKDGSVTGLYDNSGNSVSSNCGISAPWCLAAPGYSAMPGVPGTIFEEGRGAGTSGATATVTGVAALVQQAYPWMAGYNIQQTVLTTATHLEGERGNVTAEYVQGTAYVPNATYGWGLVNAWRAVHGPGQFTGEFSAMVMDYHSEFSNVISGSGSLVLNGTDGSLKLSADNTYTGGTTIYGATLALTGSVASDVTLDGGWLAGNGTVHGNVDNVYGVVVSTNATPGAGLTIDGNYTAGADSFTSIALGHALSVGKTASLDGALSLTAPEDAYTPKSTETVLTAGTVDGAFATVDDSTLPLYTAKVSYTGTTVDAALTRKDVAQANAAARPVIAQTAQGIEGALQQADDWSRADYAGHRAFLDTAAQFLAARSEAEAAASIGSLSGEIHGTTNALEAAASAQIDHAVALHQSGLQPVEGYAFWTQGLTADGGLSQEGFASASYRANGTLFGLDANLGHGLTGGLMAGTVRTHTNTDGFAGRVDERDTFAGAYAAYRFDNGSYLAGRASWTHADLDTTRTALLGGDTYRLSSERTDRVGRLTLEVGRHIGTFTPYLSVTALRIRQDGFTENGANGFGLTAEATDHNATLANVGVRWNRAFSWAGGDSTVTAYAAYQRVLGGADLGFTGALAGTPNATFVVASQSLPRNVGQAGVTLDTRINNVWSWYVNLDAQGAKGRYHAFGANAGVRVGF